MRELERDFPTPSAAAQQAELPALVVVGAGRVGSSIAAAARRAGLEATLVRRGGAPRASGDGETTLLLCVPDAAIGEVAGAIAARGPVPRFAGHTSGVTTLGALGPLAERGASTFSLHPLQTVPDRDTDMTSCPAAVCGSDAAALALAEALAERLEMRPFEVEDGARAAYHAAACMASNFLVVLEESAAAVLERAGAERGRELLAPLVLRTAANWSGAGADALTGPIARGDEATVARHLEALREIAPELVPLYEALAERTRELAGR